MPRDNDRTHLHPVLRAQLVELDAALLAKNIPLQVFEGFRVPQRQADLYATGRGTGTPGHYVTKARPWESFHQYGLAVDYVFMVNGQWTWTEPTTGMWAQYTQLADSVGLRSLSFEKPHVEVPLHLSSLQAGVYPPGGDDTWQSWLEAQIEAWGPEAKTISGLTFPGAPPLMQQRPALVA